MLAIADAAGTGDRAPIEETVGGSRDRAVIASAPPPFIPNTSMVVVKATRDHPSQEEPIPRKVATMTVAHAPAQPQAHAGTYKLVPENKGKALEQIQVELTTARAKN